MAKLSIYKYVRTGNGWRYCKAAFHPNGKIKPNVVVVSALEEKHTEGRYFLNFNNHWIDVGEDAQGAQRKRLLRPIRSNTSVSLARVCLLVPSETLVWSSSADERSSRMK